jgi:uncharacterized protein with GYD domain
MAHAEGKSSSEGLVKNGDGNNQKGMAMPHFMITCDYTSAAFNKMMDNPNTNRFEAVNKMAAAAGAKVVCMFAKGDTGPGVVIIVEGPSEAAVAMACVARGRGGEHELHARLYAR